MAGGDWLPEAEYRRLHPRNGDVQAPPPASTAEILRVPPHDLDAERACLGACMLDDEIAKKVAQILAPSDFYRTAHGRVYAAVAGLALEGHPCDPLLVKDALEKSKELEEVGGSAYLAELGASVATPANGVSYARIVAEKSAARGALRVSYELQRAVYDGERAGFLIEGACESLTTLARSHATNAVEPMEFLSGSQMSSSRSNVNWIWRGYVAEGALTLIVGHPKSGKSTIGYALLAALERGDANFCGLHIAPGASAVYMSEESQATIREKILRFSLTDKTRFLTREQAFPPRPLRAVVEAAVAEAKRVEAKILVVDTLAVWAHLPPDAEKDAGAAQKALEPLLWAAAQGLAVIVVHHMRKADGDGGTSVRGSSAFLATVDVLLELRRFGEGDDSAGPKNQRTLTATSRFEETPEQMVVQLDGDRFSSAGSTEKARLTSKGSRVSAWLDKQANWTTTTAIQDALGGRKTDTLAALDELLASGKIRRIGGSKSGAFLWGSLSLQPPVQPPGFDAQNGHENTPR